MNGEGWCVPRIAFYSTTKKNEIMSLEGTWLEQELIVLRNQSDEDKY